MSPVDSSHTSSKLFISRSKNNLKSPLKLVSVVNVCTAHIHKDEPQHSEKNNRRDPCSIFFKQLKVE